MLSIWTSIPEYKVRRALAPVLRGAPDLPVTIFNDGPIPEGTTTLLALGGFAHKKLQELKVVPKNRAITSMRTLPVVVGGVQTLLSYSADIGEIDHRYYIDLLCDVSIAMRHSLSGTWLPVYGQYEYVPDFVQSIADIEATYAETGQPVDVAEDTETLGLDPYALPILNPPFPGAYIVCIQLSHKNDHAAVVYFDSREHEVHMLHDPAFREQLEFIHHSPKIKLRGANLKYDNNWKWVRGKLRCSNFTFDTTLVGSLLDENRSNTLDTHTKIHVPKLGGYADVFNKTVDKSRMDLVPKATMLPYAGGDTDACRQVASSQRKELLKDPKLTKFYVNILHPAARAFEHIEQTGICIDRNAFKELQADLEAENVRLIKEVSQIVGGRIAIKHRDPSRPGGLNLTKASFITDFLFSPMGLNLKPLLFTEKPDKEGMKRPATGAEHLQLFADHPEAKPFVERVQESSKVMKTLSTYVYGFLEHLRSDGRFHPTYFLFVGNRDDGEGGANTGRLTASDPAFQTIPKHTKWAPRIRRCYVAPPGYVIVERDYNQGELRVIACIAHEQAMIEAYRQGMDMHAKTAGPFRGYSYEAMQALKQTDKDLFSAIRQLGKAGNFGLAYGQQAPGFRNYARINYGVHLTEEESEEFRDKFFQTYPGLLTYHKAYIELAHKDKQVRTPMGRVRHLPLIDSPSHKESSKAERQSINSPVQGCLTDMLLWALAIEHQQGWTEEAPCFGDCHDAAYNYVLEDHVDVVVPRMIGNMENLPFDKVGWKPQLKFLADAKVGKNMGDMKEWHS